MPASRTRAVALLAAMVVAGACGDGDGESAATSTTSRSTTTRPAATTSIPPTTVPPTTASAPETTSPAAPATTAPPPPPPPPTTAAPAPPPPPPPGDQVRGSVRLTEIGRYENPLAVVVRGGDPTLYVVEQAGRIRTAAGDVVLDIRGDVGAGGERGLLGLAFHPDQDLFYVNYTDTNGDTHIVEFGFDPASRRAVGGSRRELLFVEQPYSNHNGGHLVFGPDGYLYAALGDGGSGGDPHDNAQSLGTVLGKLLRIGPSPSGGLPYTIPGDNPFAGQAGARGEIWAYGLRNPWRFSFDRATADMWIGDVGQRSREEIDFQPAGHGGRNYGWNYYEGSERYRAGDPPPDAVGPVYDYARAGGNCAVTAGYVYRGAAISRLAGHFVFGDFCRGELLALVDRGGYFEALPVGGDVSQLSSFGQDHDGELYAVSLAGPVYRLDPA